MKYNITLNSVAMIENDLNVSKWCILDILSVAPTWCEIISHNEENYFWVARQKICDELIVLDLKPDTVFRYLSELKIRGFIDYEKQGKKDLVRLTELGKSLFTMSEKNPNYYVGKKSEKNSEKNPTYNNTNSYNNKTININPLLSAYMEVDVNITENGKNEILEFIEYRKKIKKPIKTIAPIKAYVKVIRELIKDGYKLEAIKDLMRQREWQNIESEWVKKSIKKDEEERYEW